MQDRGSLRTGLRTTVLDKQNKTNKTPKLKLVVCRAPGSISSPGWRRGSVTPRVTTFPCPGCQHDIDLGERGISMLFRNFTLESIVERYRQAARAATAIVCNMCKPPTQQEATKSCMDCKASYCNECFKLHHPWGTPKAQHEYVGPTTNFRPKVDRGHGGREGLEVGGEGEGRG